jgi:sulfite exporter TauE/SafE/copper chaperone CopZ
MSQDKSIKVSIKGMHCPSCELLVEDSLKDVVGVKKAEVSHKSGEATIYYNEQAPDRNRINKAIKTAGYEVGQEGKLPLLTKDKKEYASLGIAFLFLMCLFLVLRSLGLTNIDLGSDLKSPGIGLILVIGLVAGFSTCMALVGGLSLGLSARFVENHPTATPAEKFRPHLFFVLGRVLAYALLGGVLGLIGKVFQFSVVANGILTIILGLVMLIMGLQLINIFPRLNNFKITLPKSIGRAFGFNRKDGKYSHYQAMTMGALTFFLPCGFTQAMQIYAVSMGDFISGAIIMGLFALGTAPGLLSIGGVASLVKGRFKERFFKTAGLAVIFFGLFNLNNGYTLASLNFSGFGSSDSSQTEIVDPNVTMEDGYQVVHMVENGSGYSPNKFSIKKDVPVKWVIDAQAPYSCASAIVVPKLAIRQNLVAGENTIEFTPREVGQLPFSCSMGMYTGVFTVYDEGAPLSDNSINTNVVNSAEAAAPTASGGSGSCGMASGGGGCGCGGGAKVKPDTTDTSATQTSDVQIISTTYTQSSDIKPNSFTVKAGKPVKLVISVKEDGAGCMSYIKIPDLYDSPQLLEAGKTITMEFTPTEVGDYPITCAMGMKRGIIKVQ